MEYKLLNEKMQFNKTRLNSIFIRLDVIKQGISCVKRKEITDKTAEYE